MFLHAPGWSCAIAVVSLLLGCRDSEPAVAFKDLRNENAQERADAASRLGQARATEAVGSLVAVLDDSDETVRVTAIRALGQIGDRKAVPALVRRGGGAPPRPRRARSSRAGRSPPGQACAGRFARRWATWGTRRGFPPWPACSTIKTRRSAWAPPGRW